MANIITNNRISRAFQASGDWRFRDKTIRLANGKSMGRSKAKNVIVNLDQTTQRLTRNELDKWRKANQVAIDIENPKRGMLYPIYTDALLDLHLKGAIRNRKLKVIGKPFHITDVDGNKDPDLTLLLRAGWLKKFINYALDSTFWGATLIQFGDILRDEGKLRFEDIEVVPRHHVVPEYDVVLNQESDPIKKGIDFTKNEWCILVGDKKDLGSLLALSKEAISKKFILQFWDQFAEMFGAPIRIATTPSRDEKDLNKIEDMMENMGAASWGVFAEGTEIKLEESKQSDSYAVYDKRIDRANSEMSKEVSGQTMTMDNGSSRSQAEVHAEVSEDIMNADREFIQDLMNDVVFPFLMGHGFPLQGKEFRWDDTYVYSAKEMLEIEKMILEHYDVEPQYFIDKYGVTVTGKKEVVPPTQENLSFFG